MATTNREAMIELITATTKDVEKVVDAVWRCVEYADSAIGEVWLDRAKAIAGVRHILAEHDAKAAVPAGALKTDREAWLLSELSSMTRLTIGVEQYEELRALANRLARVPTPSPDAEARAEKAVVCWERHRGVPVNKLDRPLLINAIAAALTASEAEVIERCIELLKLERARFESGLRSLGASAAVAHQSLSNAITALQSLKGGKDK